MPMSERIRLRIGSGPLGTGVFLLARHAVGTEAWSARAWVTFLFLPLVPLRPATFHGRGDAPAGETWDVERTPLVAPRPGDVARTYAASAGVVVLTLAPVVFAWWTIHLTGLLQALKVVIGSSVLVLVLMWRDLRTPRVVR
jgi:hypothetical protein